MMAPTWKPDATRILSRSEIARVLADVERKGRRSINTRQNGIVFRLATCCGLRASEIAGVRLSDLRLDLERPFLRVPKAVAKGGKERKVPLWWDGATLAALAAWKDARKMQGARPSDPLVCAQSKTALGNGLDRRNIRARFLAACAALGLERRANLTVHDGRHSFATHALAGGRSLPEVRDALGHSSIAVTNIYAHLLDDDGAVGDLFTFGA